MLIHFELVSNVKIDKIFLRTNGYYCIITGQRPSPSRGTHVEIIPASKLEPKRWGAYVLAQNGNILKLHVMTPPTCAVGRWELKIDVIEKGETSTITYRYNDKGRIYILFNPWCKGEQVSKVQIIPRCLVVHVSELSSAKFEVFLYCPAKCASFYCLWKLNIEVSYYI